ncbi:hypothetical protein ACFT38_05025 [Streptomyces sp. NPDC056975]|uniref:hypothetical protein n=1 Tax=Streptomyces sp. NPDC056975 TaxID=3345985 RepID=UPI00364460E2
MNIDEYQTTFLLYAPAKNPQGWALDLGTFGEALREGFPEVGYQTRQNDEGEVRLSFSAVTDSGIEITGFAKTEARDTVLIADASVDEAATFIAWLRDAYVPSPDLVRFTTEAAFERGIDSDWRVPATGDRGRIADELKQHIHVVEG